MLEFAEKVKSVFKKGLFLWQAHAIQKLCAGHDLMIQAGTGSGESLPVQAMALSRPDDVAMVVSPLLALMDNQVDSAPSRANSLTVQGRDTPPLGECQMTSLQSP
jgi:superfamily II DNA helicase RecQ